MRRDRFEHGQWFKGRIYARRSDLSPDGQFLVYFASKFNAHTVNDREYTYAWTAVSRPPWLTALALWPKGDCWWGGGMFTGKRSLLLNHRPNESTPHPKHAPRGLAVESNPDAHGEDDPIYSMRLERDGWFIKQEWAVEWGGRGLFYKTTQPEIRERCHKHYPFAVAMERRLDGLKYHESFTFVGSRPLAVPGAAEWLDWDSRGRLFALASGQLLVAQVTADGPGEFEILEDFTGDSFEPREAPRAAREW